MVGPEVGRSPLKSRQSSRWTGLCWGALVFPLSPFLGGLAVLGTSLLTVAERWRSLVRRRLLWGLCLFLGLLLLSSLQARDRPTALLGLFHFVPYVLVFAATSCAIDRPARLHRLSVAIALSSLPVALIGMGQMALGWHGPLDWGLLLSWDLAAGGDPPGRMSSVFDYANVLANFAAIAGTLALGLWVRAWRERRGRAIALWTAVLLGNAIALIWTSSRNGWGVAFLVCVAYAGFLGWRAIVAGVGAIAAVVLASAYAPSPLAQLLRQIVPAYFWARLTDDLHPDRSVALLRTTQWQFAVELARDRPFFGWGLRNFTALYEEQMGLWLGHPHNLVVMLMAETGGLATAVLLGCVGWILWRGIVRLRQLRSRQDAEQSAAALSLFAAIAALGATVLFHGLDVTLFDSRINVLGWLLLGAIDGVAGDRAGDRAGKATKTPA